MPFDDGVPGRAKAIAFTTEISHNVGEINADRRAVQQMLINLVSNAIKFTPAGGEVTIGAKRVGSRLHFWVSDNGIGIDAERSLPGWASLRAGAERLHAAVRGDRARPVAGEGAGRAARRHHDGRKRAERGHDGDDQPAGCRTGAEEDAGQQRDDISDDKSGSNEGTDGSLRKTA